VPLARIAGIVVAWYITFDDIALRGDEVDPDVGGMCERDANRLSLRVALLVCDIMASGVFFFKFLCWCREDPRCKCMKCGRKSESDDNDDSDGYGNIVFYYDM